MPDRRGPLRGLLVRGAVFALLLSPYLLLVVISLGSGWTFPRLLPDRVDFAPWRHFVSDRDGMLQAIATSAGMSIVVALVSTSAGLLIGRAVRRSRSFVGRLLIYLPFVVSPVIVSICLYSLLIQLHLAGTIVGVILLQCVFATAFSAVFFSELWSARSERLEQLVSNLGGTSRDVWRHAVIPPSSGLILVCLIQTALYSWLDYGLVSVVGGGRVNSVTTRLFSYIREASVNQAAQSSLILLGPAAAGFVIMAVLYLKPSRAVQAVRRDS